MYTRTLPGPEKQPSLHEFFYECDIQLQIQVSPPQYTLKNVLLQNCFNFNLIYDKYTDRYIGTFSQNFSTYKKQQ